MKLKRGEFILTTENAEDAERKEKIEIAGLWQRKELNCAEDDFDSGGHRE